MGVHQSCDRLQQPGPRGPRAAGRGIPGCCYLQLRHEQRGGGRLPHLPLRRPGGLGAAGPRVPRGRLAGLLRPQHVGAGDPPREWEVRPRARPQPAHCVCAGTWPTSPAAPPTAATRWAWPWRGRIPSARTWTRWGCRSSSTTRCSSQQPGSTDTECCHHVQDSIAGPIDQHYFKDPLSGKDYLIWKTDELVLPFNPSVVYIQELAESGTAFAEGSVKTKILQTDRLMFQLLRNYSAMTDP